MLDMFEKLINEHGSSVILKERIELINDKYEALEGKLANSEKEKELIAKENELLKYQVQQLETQVADSQPREDSLPQEQEAILKLLFNASSRVREELIARELSLEMGVLNYHLDELHEKEFLGHPGYAMGNPLTNSKGYREQSISKTGRKYVVECIGT